MKFYKFHFKIEEREEDREKENANEAKMLTRQYRHVFESAFGECSRKTYIFVSSICADNLDGAALTSETSLSPEMVEKVVGDCKITVLPETLVLSECDSHTFAEHLQEARNEGYISRPYDILEAFSPLNNVFELREAGIWQSVGCYHEKMCQVDTRSSLEEKAKDFLWGASLGQEFDRIYAKAAVQGTTGIPVHYILAGNNYDTREKATDILISALYENGRIQQKRYAEIGVSGLNESESSSMSEMFEVYRGGAVVFRFNADARRENGMADTSVEIMKDIGCAIRTYKNAVQVIFCFPLECEKEKERLLEHLGGVSFVTLEEGSVDQAGAVRYIVEKAKQNGYTSTVGLEERLSEDKRYRALDLDKIYDDWSAGYLKNVVYPQYARVMTLEKQELAESPLGNAYDRLQRMAGLQNAKQVIQNAVHYYKAQKLLASRGMGENRASMHMVFTGNPGTAKTTVARLFAEIMRDNRVLSSGHLVEVGRGDLVGKYVGWTAKTVQGKFREARGGVLFIDEAYSLVDDHSGSFGDEAIHTICAEMENNRNSLVVIFAGYPNEMETFLSKNPGLCSRIAFHIHFDDYTPDELYEITKSMAEDQKLRLNDGVHEKLQGIYRRAVNDINFGNGRFVRNLLEKAHMHQATRLMTGGLDEITDVDLATLVADDFEYEAPRHSKPRIIGFGG